MNYITLILLLLSAAAAVIESSFDAKTKNPEHVLSASIRVVVALGLSWFFFLGFWFQALNTIAMLVVFWIVFDPMYNVFSGRNIHRMGKTSFLDRMALKIGADMYGYTALKGVVLVIVLTLMGLL